MKLRRKTIRVEIDSCMSPYDLCGPIDTIIFRLQELKERHEKEFGKLELDFSPSHCYECSGNGEFVLRGTRSETDKELSKRQRLHDGAIKANKAMQDKRQAKELATLQKLLKKYKECKDVAIQEKA